MNILQTKIGSIVEKLKNKNISINDKKRLLNDLGVLFEEFKKENPKEYLLTIKQINNNIRSITDEIKGFNNEVEEEKIRSQILKNYKEGK